MGSVRIRKRSSNTASDTMRATSSGSLMGPAALLTKDDDEDPSIGVRTPRGANRDTRIPLLWYVIDSHSARPTTACLVTA